ncbi:MAG: hypothetical protein GKR87_00525 [Kiritimatiellae bacterium]|nr:hypothetical protein [Kiritimatiellia bacterium]
MIEIKRIDAQIEEVIKYIEGSKNFRFQPYEERIMAESMYLCDHRDPFDQIVLATAKAMNLPLITRDRWMSAQYNQCVW